MWSTRILRVVVTAMIEHSYKSLDGVGRECPPAMTSTNLWYEILKTNLLDGETCF